MSHRRALTLAATSLLALGLTACGDDAAKPTTESASTSAGPTTSAAPATTSAAAETTPVTTPPASTAPAVAAPDPADYPGMDQQTEEGAKQTFRYFWATYLHGYEGGAVEPFSSTFDHSCSYCNSAKEDLDTHARSSSYWSDAAIEDLELTLSEFTQTGAVVTYVYRLSSHTEPSDDGSSQTDEPATVYATAGRLTWHGDRWLVTDVDIESSNG